MDDGLSQSTVWCILQDAKGFLWFGTGDGLNRYDGYGFTVFHHDDRDSGSLIDNAVNCLAEDGRGRIWIGTDAGLCYYDKTADRFVRLSDELDPRHRVSRGEVLRLLYDHAGLLWIGTAHGIVLLDPSAALPRAVARELPPGAADAPTQALYEGERGSVWVSSGDSLFAFAPGAATGRSVPLPVKHAAIASILQDCTGILWLGTVTSAVLSLDPATGHCELFRPAAGGYRGTGGNHISAIAEDRSGRLWVGTRLEGLSRFDRATHRWERFDPGVAGQRFEGVTTLCVDRSGLLWVGYDGAGIVKVRTTPIKFRHVLLPEHRGSVTGENFFKPVMVDHRQKLWIGTFDRGLAVIDRLSGRIRRYTHSEGNPATLSSDAVLSLLEDRGGRVWVGTTEGIDMYDPLSGGFVHYAIDIRGGAVAKGPGGLRVPTGVETRCFCQDSTGAIWAGTMRRLLRLQGPFHRFQEVKLSGALSAGLEGAWIECIAAASDGTLWLGTALNGLVRIDANGTVLGVFGHDGSGRLSHPSVKSIYCRDDGTVWVGTVDGLNYFTPGTGAWRQYRETDGLPDGTIYGILPAGRSTLWMSTNRGLARMEIADPAHPKFRNYTPDDGLQSYEFNTGSYFKTPKGEMLFGGINGLTDFFPDSVRDNPAVPPVVLTGFKKFDQPASPGMAMELVRDIELAYTESVFSFEFAALEYTNPKRNRYAYRLEGLEKEWVECGNRREARYTNLAPGTYIFRVRASNDDGVWNDAGTAVTVTIVPPFWQRLWFLAIVGLAVAVTFGAAVRAVAVRKLRKEIDALERQRVVDHERQTTRDRIARDLHDEVSSTLSSMSLFVESSRVRLKRSGKGAGDVLDRLHGLARDAEDAMEQAVWSLSSHHDALSDLVARVRDVAYETCAESDIRCAVTVGEIPPDVLLREGTRKNIYLIFRESLANAAKHARAGVIEVRMGIDADRFVLSVRDDGKGFTPGEAPPRTRGGNGLKNILFRAGEIGAEVSVTSGPGVGTTVLLSIEMAQLRH